MPVDRHGLVDPERLVDATRPDTALVHLQWANHEVATRQPVEQVAELLAGGVDLRDSSRSARRSGTPVPAAGAPHVALLHTDAAQAGAAAPQAVASGADLVSLSGHKLGGPVGIGVLVVRRNLRIGPLFVGGDQERARRAGMENVAAAVGLAAVAEELSSSGAEEARRLAALGDRLVDWAASADGIHLPPAGDETLRGSSGQRGVAHLPEQAERLLRIASRRLVEQRVHPLVPRPA